MNPLKMITWKDLQAKKRLEKFREFQKELTIEQQNELHRHLVAIEKHLLKYPLATL